MKTEAIERYLREQYSDEKLAALLAHAEDGKLAYRSCCCLVGAVNADHPLVGKIEERDWGFDSSIVHLAIARRLEGAYEAENEFHNLGVDIDCLVNGNPDAQRRSAVIPLIRAEIARRDKMREVQQTEPASELETAAA